MTAAPATPQLPLQLPPQLQPWSAWLALFPDDLAATLGQLLLRLQPLVGPLRRHDARTAVEPAGVGDIVLRGSYDRLLMSEWALADSVPDEFLRRAASGELLFTGPEPANSETSLRSVALFDAGPAQLGEARLAHLALFILLARRAELAGAEFRWGVLQEPGVLHDVQGASGVRKLLDARTHATLDADGLAEWETVLGQDTLDCWLVGDPLAPCPAQASARVLVRRAWFEDALEVELVQRRRTSQVTLPLPAPDNSVRLLRRPFDKPVAGTSFLAREAHSLKRAPMFGNLREWLAVGTVDGGVTVYRIPDSQRAGAGRPRNQGKLRHAESIVAAGLHQKSFGTVALRDGELHFSNFPGPAFSKLTLPLPDPDFFRAVPGALRWAQAFFWMTRGAGGSVEEVLVLDKDGRLVCWNISAVPGRPPSDSGFRLVSRDVIGAIQHADRVLFAVSEKGRSDVYSVSKGKPVREHLYPIMHPSRQILFGAPQEWRGGSGMYALRLDDSSWLAGDAGGAEQIAVSERDIILGCARTPQTRRPALVVLHADRLRISLVGKGGKQTLADSAEPIAQASFDPAYGRLAWLGQKSGALVVRAIDPEAALLRVVPKGGSHAE